MRLAALVPLLLAAACAGPLLPAPREADARAVLAAQGETVLTATSAQFSDERAAPAFGLAPVEYGALAITDQAVYALRLDCQADCVRLRIPLAQIADIRFERLGFGSRLMVEQRAPGSALYVFRAIGDADLSQSNARLDQISQRLVGLTRVAQPGWQPRPVPQRR